MSGSTGGFVSAVTKLMKSSGEVGSHVLRRTAMHALAAVVAGATPARPLRAETRAEAAKVIIRGMTPEKAGGGASVPCPFIWFVHFDTRHGLFTSIPA